MALGPPARGQTEEKKGVVVAAYAILYFTGTGNTAHAAEVFASEIQGRGGSAALQRVRREVAPPLPRSDVLVVMFPVYSFTAPRTLFSRLRRLPRVSSGRAAVIENHGMLSMKGGAHTGYGGACTRQAASILRRKGYDVIFLGGVGYPENVTILANAISETSAREVMEAGDAAIRRMAQDIDTGAISLRRFPLPARLLSAFGRFLFNGLGSWQAGKMFAADEKCNSCGLCVRGCPASAIRLAHGRPRWSVRCTFCLGCFNTCPSRAVQVSIPRLLLFLAASVAPLLVVIACFSTMHRWLDDILPVTWWISDGLSTAMAYLGAALLYGVLFVVAAFSLDAATAMAERIPALRRVLGWTYTRRFIRYAAPGFKPFAALQDPDTADR
jgi:ferredoxin